MTEKILQIEDEASFTRTIADGTPVLVDYWAAWCGPCRGVAPVLEALAGELEGSVRIAKANVDRLPELAAGQRISGIPTLVLYQDGREIDRLVGAAPKAMIAGWLATKTAVGAK